MRCAKCRRMYDAAAENRLSARQREKIRNHLSQCPSCALVWQENEGLRTVLCESAKPERVPSAEYFARLARKAVEAAEAERRADSARPRLTVWASLTAWVGTVPRGAFRLAQAAVLLAVGVSAGYFLSNEVRGISSTEVVRPLRLALNPAPTPSPEVREALPSAPPAATPAPEAVIAYAVPAPAAPAAAVEPAGESRPIMKVESAPTPVVDVAAVVAALQKFSEVLDKMKPSEEVERLRQIQRVSQQIQASAVLARLQDLKLQMVRTGQTDYIPDVHRIEEVFHQLASASRDRQASEFLHLDTYQKAEDALIKKRYDEAMRLFKVVIIQAPGSYLAARAMYQRANINFEYYRDFKNAIMDYNQCLTEFPRHFVAEPIQKLIHERVELIAQNSTNDYAPLKLYYKAEATSRPAAAVPLYAALLKQYPQSTLIKPAIDTLVRLARQNADDAALVGQILDAFDQFQDQNPAHPAEMHAQLAIADVTHFCVRNRQQAILEYTKVLDKSRDPELVRIAQERLRSLEKAP
ncbi:MAG: zf-HC2 domain-containing protein [Candidatus Sumerlaeia bacterium]|nr:zf-HC2 domain-containing protein [Candidatus Sumerlaeia bacterium]